MCRPYSNAYYKHWERGVYACVVCGQELFQSQTKYDSGSGWPAFYDIISWDRVTLKQDLSHGEWWSYASVSLDPAFGATVSHMTRPLVCRCLT
ncbi:hypothetical protein HAZT_HAZT000583 [Hyalella azteca]|uniref:peptide-methionine (R)-S-oxide reductase n=1 Tax=Hyalella azteca TaxID=294128 RepID=A0A6A0H9X0_HYAAZ|nr:hypothetical protein HAZT_HAZT000583 [Hyalella azteca]